jgi:cytoskeletal protein CcmA (bactofilin family)
MKRLLSIVTLAAVVALAPTTAFAGQFLIDDGAGLAMDGWESLAENAYLAGESVDIRIPALGDVFAVGMDVKIEEEVAGDVMALAEEVLVFGDVAGDVRAAGGNVYINNATVGGEVLLAGETVGIGSDGVVNGDVYMAGDTVYIGGTVKGDVEVRARYVEISGNIEGEAHIYADQVLFDGVPVFSKGLTYHAPQEAAIMGGNEFDESQLTYVYAEPTTDINLNLDEWFKEIMAGLRLLQAVTYLVSVIVFVAIARKWMDKPFNAHAGTWKDAGYSLFIGFAGFVLVPIAAVILFGLIVGSGLSTVLALFYMALLFLAKWTMAPVLGAQILRIIRKEKELKVTVWAALLGAVIIVLMHLWWPFYLVLFLLFLLSAGIILRRILSV